MKRAHIFFPHKFSRSFNLFIRKNFVEEKFDCIILSKGRIPDEFGNIEGAEYHIFENFKDELNFMIMICDKYDHIYMHSSFLSPNLKVAMLLKSWHCVNKFVWVDWGYDLYKSDYHGVKDFLKKSIKHFVQLLFDKRIPYFIGIHPIDLIEYQKRIRGKAQLFVAPYRFTSEQHPFLYNYVKQPIGDRLKQGKPITIQIGHRAEPFLNHIKVLNMLIPYKRNPIRIVLPLNYGNQKYAQKVETHARKLFGDNVVVLHDMLPYQEYLQFLSDVDVLVIDSKRQIALGNIPPMFYMQKKVFLPRDSNLNRYFKGNGLKMYDVESLGKMPWEELIHDDDLTNARDYVISLRAENTVEIWKNVFDSIK